MIFSHWARRLSLHCTNVRAILDPDCSRNMWMVIYGVVDYVKYMCSEFVATHNTMTRSISIYNRWLTKFHSIRLAALFFVYRGSPNSNFCKHHSCGYFLRFFFLRFFFRRFFFMRFFFMRFFFLRLFSLRLFPHLRVSMYSYLKIRVFFLHIIDLE